MDKIYNAYENGEINEYFFDQLRRKIDLLPEDLFNVYFDEAKNMSAAGVNSGEEQKIFFYIIVHTQDILRDLVTDLKTLPKIAEISSRIFNNRDKYPIDTLHNFYIAATEAAKEAGLTLKEEIRDKIAYKRAYPSAI